MRYLKSLKDINIQKKKEYKSLLRSDKRTYIKIKTDIENSRTGKIYIPEMFSAKYKIFQFLTEKYEILNMDNVFDDSVEIEDDECSIYYIIVDVMDIYHRIMENNESGNQDEESINKFNQSIQEQQENIYNKVDDDVYDRLEGVINLIKDEFIEWLGKLYSDENVDIDITDRRLNELYNQQGKASLRIFKEDVPQNEEDIENGNAKGNCTYDKIWG